MACDTEPTTLTPSSTLDLVRSLAVLLVVLSHLPASSKLVDAVFGTHHFNVQPMGLVGVGIFFVHTCYVLMLSLNRQSHRSGATYRATKFFVRRAFRIYPLSVTIVLVLACIYYLTGNTNITHDQIISNILLIQNVTGHASIEGPLWSLPYEVQMYLVLPMLYLFVHRSASRAPIRIVMLWCASVVLVLCVYKAGLNYNFVKYLPAFLPGVLAYAIVNGGPKGISVPAAVSVIYILCVAVSFPILVVYGLRENVILWPACLVLGTLIAYSGEIRAPAIKQMAATVAKYSYGIYLVHAPMIDLSFSYLRNWPAYLQWGVFVAGTSLASYAVFHFVEDPGIRFGKRLATAIGNRRVEGRT